MPPRSPLDLPFADPATLDTLMGSICCPTSHDALVEKGKDYTKGCLMSIIICLPSSPEQPSVAGTPIGWVTLGPKGLAESHHRKTGMGIGLLPEYQGKGYGAEVVGWAMAVAFERANLHKIEIECFAENKGARAVYEKW